MNTRITNLKPQKLLLSLGMVSVMSGVLFPHSVSSQTTSAIRILRVTSASGTTFKRDDNWFLQTNNIRDPEQKCAVKVGEKFFVTSITKNIKNVRVSPPRGNSEKIADYWEVVFEKPLPCSQLGEMKQTWFVYKKHVQELQAVPVR
jgi:hypothetical protein